MVKGSKVVNEQSDISDHSNIIDIKSVALEHSKKFCKLSKTIRKAKKVSQVSGASKNPNSPLHNEKTKT